LVIIFSGEEGYHFSREMQKMVKNLKVKFLFLSFKFFAHMPTGRGKTMIRRVSEWFCLISKLDIGDYE